MTDMTGTTMATWLPEQWSDLASITYRSNTVLVPLMDHRWEPELGVGRGDTVNIPQFSQNNSATKRSTFGTGASLTFDAVTENQTQLIVDTMAYKAFRLPVEMSVQSMPKYVTLLTDGIGEAVALYVDNDLASNNTNGLDAFTAIGTDNEDVAESTIFAAETNLNNVNAKMEGRFGVWSPASRASLFQIESVRNSLYAAMGKLDPKKGPGYIGTYLTLDFYMSNNLEAGSSGKKNAIWQREAIAMCMQKKLTMVKDLNVEDGLYNQYVGYCVYGFKLVKSTFGREVDAK